MNMMKPLWLMLGLLLSASQCLDNMTGFVDANANAVMLHSSKVRTMNSLRQRHNQTDEARRLETAESASDFEEWIAKGALWLFRSLMTFYYWTQHVMAQWGGTLAEKAQARANYWAAKYLHVYN